MMIVVKNCIDILKKFAGQAKYFLVAVVGGAAPNRFQLKRIISNCCREGARGYQRHSEERERGDLIL